MRAYEQLMKHYWGVIVPMAEAAGIKPWECVRFPTVRFDKHPRFDQDQMLYTFAITVLEGQPVFGGDRLWNKVQNRETVVHELNNPSRIIEENYSWTPPTKKRTFMLELTEEERNKLIYVTGLRPVDQLHIKLLELCDKD